VDNPPPNRKVNDAPNLELLGSGHVIPGQLPQAFHGALLASNGAGDEEGVIETADGNSIRG
jgi:hypothetical protein